MIPKEGQKDFVRPNFLKPASIIPENLGLTAERKYTFNCNYRVYGGKQKIIILYCMYGTSFNSVMTLN
jgi:hypothetical protein